MPRVLADGLQTGNCCFVRAKERFGFATPNSCDHIYNKPNKWSLHLEALMHHVSVMEHTFIAIFWIMIKMIPNLHVAWGLYWNRCDLIMSWYWPEAMMDPWRSCPDLACQTGRGYDLRLKSLLVVGMHGVFLSLKHMDFMQSDIITNYWKS